MMRVLLTILESIKAVIAMMFADDMGLISDEVKEILSNKEDAILYRTACNGPKPVTVTFSTGETITLI